MSIAGMREAWETFEAGAEQFYDAVRELPSGEQFEESRFGYEMERLRPALSASERLRDEAAPVLADSAGDAFERVALMLLAAAAVDAMLAADIASLDPAMAEYPLEVSPGTAGEERIQLMRDAQAVFRSGGERPMAGGESSSVLQDQLRERVRGSVDGLVVTAADPAGHDFVRGLITTATLGLADAAAPALADVIRAHGSGWAHVDARLQRAAARLSSYAPRFLRAHVRKILTLRAEDVYAQRVTDRLAERVKADLEALTDQSDLITGVLAGIADAGEAKRRSSRRIDTTGPTTEMAAELDADLTVLSQRYVSHCHWLAKSARWLRWGASPLTHLVAPIVGHAVIAGVYVIGLAYLGYSLTDRLDARHLPAILDRVEGVVPLVERHIPASS